MGHYDSYYEAEADKALQERLKLKEELLTQIAKTRRLILAMEYDVVVPQRFRDSLEDFENYLK